jgi:hypothetical protein
VDGIAHRMSDEQFRAMLEILRSCCSGARAAVPLTRQEIGKAEVFRKVVNVTSISGTRATSVRYHAAGKADSWADEDPAREWGPLR